MLAPYPQLPYLAKWDALNCARQRRSWPGFLLSAAQAENFLSAG
jgi:hypothetical protein